MPRKIVECIPNFSEGRRPEVIAAIETAIAVVRGVYVLDRHSDADHNRTVITFAGTPDAVAEAAYAAIAKAADLIDMDKQAGEHPRIGATDVVPFVPLAGATMEECIQLARGLGERVGGELEIPVYLYERAATHSERVNLENIRRGEYEGLKETIQSDPDRAPDFGPAQLGSAGATVIGARPPLIAYNIYLTTDDVDIAKEIARAVRHSSGGLRYVKALGMLVEGRAQVSMNLTDYTKTPVSRVQEMVRQEAERYGVAVQRAELVGLIPQAALVNAAQWYLQLDQFEGSQVLETRLYNAIEGDEEAEGSFLENLAAGTPTPGGGAAAAHAGAIAAALVGMVARLTIGKKKYADLQARMTEIATLADDLRGSLQSAAKSDAEAFDAVMEAYRLPKKTSAEKKKRSEAIERATQKATEVPLGVAKMIVRLMALATEVAEGGNVNAASDAGAAAFIARAALQGAALNVRINADNLSDRGAADGWLKELEKAETEVLSFEGRVQEALKERAGL